MVIEIDRFLTSTEWKVCNFINSTLFVQYQSWPSSSINIAYTFCCSRFDEDGRISHALLETFREFPVVVPPDVGRRPPRVLGSLPHGPQRRHRPTESVHPGFWDEICNNTCNENGKKKDSVWIEHFYLHFIEMIEYMIKMCSRLNSSF